MDVQYIVCDQYYKRLSGYIYIILFYIRYQHTTLNHWYSTVVAMTLLSFNRLCLK